MNFIVHKMALGWSPEQICGFLKRRSNGRISLSAETIYQWLLKDQQIGGGGYTYLRRAKKLRQKRSSAYKQRGKIPNKISIHQRPAIVEQRSEVAHWEGDTVVGKGKQNAIVTLAERVTGMTLIRRVGQCASITVLNAIIDMNKDVVIDTLSIDNGKEFSLHEMLAVINGKREVKRGSDIIYAN